MATTVSQCGTNGGQAAASGARASFADSADSACRTAASNADKKRTSEQRRRAGAADGGPRTAATGGGGWQWRSLGAGRREAGRGGREAAGEHGEEGRGDGEAGQTTYMQPRSTIDTVGTAGRGNGVC